MTATLDYSKTYWGNTQNLKVAGLETTWVTNTWAISWTNLTLDGLVINSDTPQTLTGAWAVDIVTATTLLITTAADALTLADWAEGQEKYIVMKTDWGDGTLTPSNLGNGTTITFDNNDSAHLLFVDGSWFYMGGNAALA